MNKLKTTAIYVHCVIVVSLIVSVSGCARKQARPHITAVGLSPANRCDPPGIPYYLPKPLLVVAKNFRHIDESKVGLTAPAPIPGAFDNQAAYADIKANVTVPGSTATPAASGDTTTTYTLEGAAGEPKQSMVEAKMTPGGRMEDGIAPDSFFTYQIIFVPDLTQKYGLQISGGAGEMRAAMNMVNGWMYTGMGPFYLKDSSSAQNAMATGVASMFAGRGAADVLNEVGELTSAIGSGPNRDESGQFDQEQLNTMAEMMDRIASRAATASLVPDTMLNYAEIYIYEPVLTPDGKSTEWRLVTHHNFNRDYFRSNLDSNELLDYHRDVLNAMVGGVSKGDTEEIKQQIEDLSSQVEAVADRNESGEFPEGQGDSDADDIASQLGGLDDSAQVPVLDKNSIIESPNSNGSAKGKGSDSSAPNDGSMQNKTDSGNMQPIQINIGKNGEADKKVAPGKRNFMQKFFHRDRPTITNKIRSEERITIK